MHSKTLTLLVAIVVVSFFGNPSKAVTPDAEQAKRELINLEGKWLHALSDADAQEQILADDFVHALPSGFITKKDQLDYLRSRKQPADDLSRHFEDMRVRIYGTAGIVNGMVVATDKSGTVIKKSVFTDVFAYRDGRWQAINAQENDFQPSSSH